MQKFITKIDELRTRAEQLLSSQPAENRLIQQADLEKIIHELDVYQIELQLQNEELQLSQKEIKLSLSKYQDLYDFSPIGILTTDSRGLIYDINLTACNYLGKGRSFLRNKPFSAYIAGSSHDTYFSHLNSVIETGKKQTCEVKAYNANSLETFFQIESVIFHENDQSFIRSAIIDITEKKNAHSVIRDRESLLRSLLESSQLPVIIFEIKGFQTMGQPILKLWESNPKANLIFSFNSLVKGVTPEELFNGNFRYMDSLIEDIYLVAMTGENKTKDVRFPLPKRFSNFKVNIVKFLHGVSLTFTDITKEVESSRQNQLILATIVDNLPNQDVHVFDIEKRIVSSGGTLSIGLGYPINSWVGNKPNEMFSNEIGSALDAVFEDALLGHTVEKEFSLFGVPVLATALPIFNDDKDVALGLCLLKNISQERKKTSELEAEKANLEIRIIERAKELIRINQEYREELEKKKALEKELIVSRQWESIGNLAAGIAHDFNNILQPINTYTTLSESLLNNASDESIQKVKNYLSRIRLSSEKGKNIVQQVINFSKTKEDSFDPIDIRHEIEEAIRSVKGQEDIQVQIIRSLTESPCYVLSYASGVFQIAFNLLQNAMHAVSEVEEPMIKITISREKLETEKTSLSLKLSPGDYYSVLIEDNGKGIPASKHQTIFEAFFTEKENIGGTGLGLAIVHGILKRLKGGIEMTSEVGIGSTFTFFLPVAIEVADKTFLKQEEISTSTKEQDSDQSQTARILLVDDDELILTSLKDAFTMMGFQVFEFNSGESALEFYRRNPTQVDILVTDQKMQGMDGTELVEKIKRMSPDLPTIVCTGYSSILNESKLPNGVDHVVVHPIKKYEVAREVKRILYGKK